MSRETQTKGVANGMTDFRPKTSKILSKRHSVAFIASIRKPPAARKHSAGHGADQGTVEQPNLHRSVLKRRLSKPMLLTEPLQPPDNQPEERKEKKAAIPVCTIN